MNILKNFDESTKWSIAIFQIFTSVHIAALDRRSAFFKFGGTPGSQPGAVAESVEPWPYVQEIGSQSSQTNDV